MDVPADDAVEPAPCRIVQPGLHEARDVAFGGAAALLDEGGQRPVAPAEPAPREVQPAVAAQDAVVDTVAQAFLQDAELGDVVVVVAVGTQQAAAVTGDVHNGPGTGRGGSGAK